MVSDVGEYILDVVIGSREGIFGRFTIVSVEDYNPSSCNGSTKVDVGA